MVFPALRLCQSICLILERQLHLYPIGSDLAPFDLYVLLDNFRNTQVPQALGGRLDD